ncbi:MAG: hypothetical protein HC876_20515 [Chloroflexaceae bacterium]|nr:hypothetical protein [Chloroflexaceae bacterium]
MVFDLDSGGTVATRYVLAAGTLLAQVQGGTPYYLLGDAQGSTRLLVTDSGTLPSPSCRYHSVPVSRPAHRSHRSLRRVWQPVRVQSWHR